MTNADFYHSNALMPLRDEAIVAKVQRNLEACEPGFIGAQARYTHFLIIFCYRTHPIADYLSMLDCTHSM